MRDKQVIQTKASALSAGLVNASILLYAIWLLIPAVQTTGGAAAGVFCVLLFGLGVLLDHAYLKKAWLDFLLRVLCAALLPLVFWFFLRRGGGHFWGYYCQQGMFWFPLLYCAYARERGDVRLWRFLPIVLLGCMVLTTLTTIGWLVEGMQRGGRIYAYSRSLGSGEPGREAYLKELMLRNIGGYDFIYASVISLPIVCHLALTRQGWARVGFWALCLAQLVMIILSQYTYAAIFAAAILAVELLSALLRGGLRKFFGRRISVLHSFLWCLLLFAALFLWRVPLVTWAAALCEGAGFSNFANSLTQLLYTLTGQASDAASRLDYYRLPMVGFAQSPLIGSLGGGEKLLSQHSDILDLLSGVGAIGAGAVLVMIWCMGRGLFRGAAGSPAKPHFLLQGAVLMACALLGTVTYSRDIPFVICAGALVVLEAGEKSLKSV